MTPNWVKWLSFPAGPREQLDETTNRKIERIHREGTKQRYEELWGTGDWERSTEPFPARVDTSERELREMADVVDEYGHDAERFLRVVRQDSEEHGVRPAEVYELGYGETPYWPEEGFLLALDDVAWLLAVCRAVSAHLDDRETEVARRFEGLRRFLEYADRHGIPPTINRGDQ